MILRETSTKAKRKTMQAAADRAYIRSIDHPFHSHSVRENP
jgi:hypothetical protein